MTAEMATPSDMLKSIFHLQTDLNDEVFANNGISDLKGVTLAMRKISEQANAGDHLVNELPNQWLRHFAKAMEEELDEFKDELLWKWWSKDSIDLQNIRVELVDILHFLVSAMIAAGLDADKVYDLYRQKHAVNLARQVSGYNRATKTVDDNRTIE